MTNLNNTNELPIFTKADIDGGYVIFRMRGYGKVALVYNKATKTNKAYKVCEETFDEKYRSKPDMYSNGECLNKEDSELIFNHYNDYDECRKVFLWDNEDSFRVVASFERTTLMRRACGIEKAQVMDTADDDFDLTIEEMTTGQNYYVKTEQNQVTVNIHKVDGKAYFKIKNKVRFANVENSYAFINYTRREVLSQAPQWFLKKIQNFLLEEHIDIYARPLFEKKFNTPLTNSCGFFKDSRNDNSEGTYFSVSNIETLLFYSYYKGLQHVITDFDFSPEVDNLSTYRAKKIRDASSKKEIVSLLYPNLSKKQVSKSNITFESSFILRESFLVFSLLKNKDYIGKYIELLDYNLPLTDAATSSKNKHMLKCISTVIDLDKIELLIAKALKLKDKSDIFNQLNYISDIFHYSRVITDLIATPTRNDLKSLKDFHDFLKGQYQAKKDSEYSTPISYIEEDRALEYQNNQFDLRLAESKAELSTIGDQMGICVGHLYSDRAFSKSLTILNIFDKNTNKPLLTIEQNNDGVIVQAKLKYNERMKFGSDIHTFFTEWASVKNLTIDTIDYETSSQPSMSTHSYYY